jgi:hypothetical protein
VSELHRVAWYRFHATFPARWGGHLSGVILIGLVGGLDAVPVPSAPMLSILVIALVSVVVAIVVAMIPGRVATRTALILRSE